MSLITKTTLFYLAIILLVFGIGGVTIYEEVRKVVALETDYALLYNFRLTYNGLLEGQETEELKTDKIQVFPIESLPIVDTSYFFSDTIAMHPQLRRLEAHRHLTTLREVNDTLYQFDLLEVFIEEDDVLEGVFGVISRLFVVLSLVLLLFSFLISRKLIHPFKKILNNLKEFNLKNDKPINLPETSTKEFKELNLFIREMTQKARQDYISLKEFSENASHEMQTPLAVAKGKLEILLESSDLTNEQLHLIQDAQNSITKLSKLGQALSLLTKIENQEFSNIAPINISAIVTDGVTQFKEIANLKGLNIESSIEPEVFVNIEPSLADILVGNLLKNAIQHNTERGFVKIILTKTSLEVANPGKKPNIPTRFFFERFKKDDQTSGTLGLGLPIVKKICEVNKLQINYHYHDGLHRINVEF